MKRLSTQLMYSTLVIRCKKSNGEYSTGTGFFFHFKLTDDKVLVTVITNKHVVEDSIETIGIMQEADIAEDGAKSPKNHGFQILLPPWGSMWTSHPSKEVDLCLAPIDANKPKIKDSYFLTLNEELIRSDTELSNLTAVEDVLMVGYPLGRFDSVHHLPIFRKGITASHPAIDYNGQSLGLTDISVFPGSSGSPILIVNEGWYIEGQQLKTGNKTLLLGILSQYYAVDVLEDDLPKDVPTGIDYLRGYQVPANLGVYVKAKEILVLKDEVLRLHPELNDS